MKAIPTMTLCDGDDREVWQGSMMQFARDNSFDTVREVIAQVIPEHPTDLSPAAPIVLDLSDPAKFATFVNGGNIEGPIRNETELLRKLSESTTTRTEIAAPTLNAETMLGNRPIGNAPTRSSRVIDLRKRYDIHITPSPVGWEAVDWETFDPDPESRYCITGSGKTTQEAVTDLLEQMAALVAADVLGDR